MTATSILAIVPTTLGSLPTPVAREIKALARPIVYRITCIPSGKVYIGLTRQKYLSERWSQHVLAAKAGSKNVLASAIRKYGVDAFERSVIAYALNPDSLGLLEKTLIAQYDCISPKGYNLTDGGESAYIRKFSAAGLAGIRAARNDPDARARNSERNKARTATEIGRAHQSRMVDLAREAVANLCVARKAYAATTEGRAQLLAASSLGAIRSRELHSKRVAVGDVVYESVRAAGEAFDIARAAVRWRIKSTRFSDWSFA